MMVGMGSSCSKMKDPNAFMSLDSFASIESGSDPIVGLAQNYTGSGQAKAEATVELYVLPGYPRSGMPVKQVERTCSTAYRVSTSVLILLNLGLAIFCTQLASNALMSLEDEVHSLIGWYAVAIFGILVILEMPVIYFFLDSWFKDALRDEYLESGDFMPMHYDDSSMSTAASDVFLSMTKPIDFTRTMS
mmetsp:Transcript_14408/g.21975  ORF Transcript_14408/g.21975 Transcript_14408/m.21975 type:complete len:190 (+) Transcript_14408:1-570(+)